MYVLTPFLNYFVSNLNKSNLYKEMDKDQQSIEKIKNADPLFGEKRLQEIAASLSEEDKKRYAKIGEEMYNSINFEDINSQGTLATQNADQIEMENASEIKIMLRSGMHISYLTRQEKDIMKNVFGNKWYEEFGFLETDENRVNF
jgi:hypothetical protein